jgi:hypothetical protein
MQQVSQSRIGQEVKIATQTLILGSKIFYDFMSLRPNEDMVSWASSYEHDINQLSNNYQQVNSLKGPSLTGKNTIIEDLVNRSYESQFK